MISLAARVTHLRNRYFLLGDALLLPLAVYLSFVLRLDGFMLGDYGGACLAMMALTLVLAPLTYYCCGIYSRYWRYAVAEESLLLIGTVLLAAAVVVAAITLALAATTPSSGRALFPRSIPSLFVLLALVATIAPRLVVRLIAGRARVRRTAGTPTLVIGAGQAGAMIVRELRRNADLGLDVKGFVDDDPGKAGARIVGVRVLGARTALRDIVARHAIRRAIIAMPTAPGGTIRDIVESCRRVGVEVQTVPGLYEVIGGRVSVRQLCNVQIEDLLRREPIRTDLVAVESLLRGRRVLVTGAGGSIGSELCRQILRLHPATLVLLGHGENSIFDIHNELQRLSGDAADTNGADGATELSPVIADVRFPNRLRQVFAEHRPEIVFHAAAHKHVPLMEANPAEAVANNVLGTRNVLAAAVSSGVERFVMVSTDKAVNPTSVMGATKRVAELLVHRAAAEHGRDFIVTRFGNVLGSRGNVVLQMRRQIALSGPVTVTHPEMTRFFMTIPEAAQLVLQAATLGRGGEVFVFDMGKPVRIDDLARDLIRLTGAEQRGIEIVYTGIRPGEKLYEELFTGDERYERTKQDGIFVADNAHQLVPADLSRSLAVLEAAVGRDDATAVVAELRRLLPEFRPAEDDLPAARVSSEPGTTGSAEPPRSVPRAGVIPPISRHPAS